MRGKDTHQEQIGASGDILGLRSYTRKEWTMSVTVSYTGTNVIRTVDQLVQWTVGQTLTVIGLTFSGKLYARCEIFGKSLEALTSACEGASGNTIVCPIPDDVLCKDGTLVLNLTDVLDGRATVVCTVQVPVRKAAKPTDWIPDPSKVITIDSLISKVDAAAKKANDAVGKADMAVSEANKAVAGANTAAAEANEAASTADAAAAGAIEATSKLGDFYFKSETDGVHVYRRG